MSGRLDLVTLLVEDVAEASRFYRDVVGLEVIKDSKGYVELASGGVRLALFARARLAELLQIAPEEAGPVDLSFLVEDLSRSFAEIVARGGASLVPPSTMPWGKRAAFVRDPDGNLVELVEARPVL